MKILDRYISKNFIKAFFLSLMAFMGIFIVSQLFRVVKYLSDGRFSVSDAGYYIVTLLPRIFIDVAPLAVLLGSMMTISTMASNLEIISLKTSGIKFKRIILFPIVISAIISGVVFYVNDTLYPTSLKINRDLRRGEVEERVAPVEKRNAFLRGENSNYIYLMQKVNRVTGFAENIEIVDLNKEFNKIERIVTAHEGRYNFSKSVWTLKDATIYYGDEGKKSKVVKYFRDDKYNDNPEHFITLSVEPRTLSIKELKKTIREMKSIGGDTRELLVELGNRYSFPFASFVISFLGLALGGRYVRGTSAVSLGVCVLLGYGYYVVQASFEALSANGFLNPFIGGWIPNIIFLGVGIYLLNKAEY
ncbi:MULTISPECIES: LptF/LptG family permease [unclassified Fusobacterium]|uniref:LptF/LptG family permease n=1 Tax=unclassified Fusobacterium TaxID=2648384 RepID=UPI0025BE511A|nr:LptF/LptG family permease [Fusobacterium sp.]